jgi:hypothetical protein
MSINERGSEGALRAPSKYQQPEALKKLFPVLRKEADPEFARAASGINYASQVVFVLFSALIIVEIFVKQPRALLIMHSARFVALMTVVILTMYSIYRGQSIPELRIEFYIAELLVLMGVNIATLVINSIHASERPTGQPLQWSDYFNIGVPAALILTNLGFLGQELYRFKLGKRTSPINSIFTVAMAGFSAYMSVKGALRAPLKPLERGVTAPFIDKLIHPFHPLI